MMLSTSSHRLQRRPFRGITLIELMIAVAIVGILAAVAYPSYTSYIRKGKRATAQTALMELASKQQTYLLDRRTYTADLTALSFAAPTEIANDYTFTVTPNPITVPTEFTATATPIGGQNSGGEQVLTINQAGVKTPANTSGYWGK